MCPTGYSEGGGRLVLSVNDAHLGLLPPVSDVGIYLILGTIV